MPQRLALDLDTWIDAGRAVLEISGELDLYSADTLRDELARLTAPAPPRIALVMTGVAFLDSSGIGVLVGAVKRAAAGHGGIALVGCNPQIKRMLTVMGLHRVFGLHDSLEAALAWLDEGRATGGAA